MANPVVTYILNMVDNASKTLEDTGKEAEKTAQSTQSLKESMDSSVTVAANFGKAILAGATAMVVFNQQMADSRNELSDMSTRTGIASETLAGLRLAAQGSGQSLGNLEGALVSLPKRMSDFARGTGESKVAFEALGIQVLSAQGGLRSTDTVLREITSALSGVENPTERAALATQLFGESGTKLLQALGDPSSLESFIALSTEFGVDVGPQAAKAAADWQRQVTDLQTVLAGAADTISTSLGVSGAGGVIDDLSAGLVFMTVVAEEAVAGLKEDVGGIVRTFIALKEAIEQGSLAPLNELSDMVGRTDVGLARLPGILETATTALTKFRAQQAAVRKASEGDGVVTGGGGGGLSDDLGLKEAKEEAEDVNALLREMGLLADTFTDVGIGINIEAIGKEETAAIGDSLKETGDALDRFTQANIAATDATNKAAEAAAEEVAVRRETQATAVAAATQFGTGDVAGGVSSLASSNPIAAIIAAIVQAIESIGKEGADAIIARISEFQDNILAGIEELPNLIPGIIKESVSFIPELVMAIANIVDELIIGIVEGIGHLLEIMTIELPKVLIVEFIPALIKSLGNLVKEFMDSLTEGRLTERFTDNQGTLAGDILETVIDPLNLGGDIFESFQTGGVVPRTQLALVHQGERIRARGGSFTQQGRSLGERTGAQGGGGPALHFHSAVMSPDAIPALVREIERVYGSFGRGSSFLFGGG